MLVFFPARKTVIIESLFCKTTLRNGVVSDVPFILSRFDCKKTERLLSSSKNGFQDSFNYQLVVSWRQKKKDKDWNIKRKERKKRDVQEKKEGKIYCNEISTNERKVMGLC